MANSESNKNLHNAKNQKKDEFYTQLSDIENEMKYHNKSYFKNKVVYCNCDDPRISNFFHYFSYNFEKLKLKKLIATCYKNQEMDLFSKNDSEKSIYLEYNGDKNGNKIPDIEEIGIQYLEGDGDFRNKESIEILKQSDIVVTNPPFSLFREFVQQLIDYKKKFLIIGNLNAITYKETFKLLKENKMWLGPSIISGDREFGVPDEYPLKAAGFRIGEDGRKYIRVKGVRWFTNLKVKKLEEEIPLYKNYDPKINIKYDNYNAVNVDKTNEIPIDYFKEMGVPITFMDKYNSKQFEILGITSGRDEFEARPTKRYIQPKQINLNGKISNGSKANTRATILLNKKPNDIYYTAENVKGYLKILYARIIIKRIKKKK
ncbi:MAG: adenine-specific methyltransferase EcoRI family protein [Candidatus Pelagibacterales bacterium]